MSTYQYHCNEHGPFDIQATFGEPPSNAICPICGGIGRRDYICPEIRWKGIWPHKDKSSEFGQRFPDLDRAAK